MVIDKHFLDKLFEKAVANPRLRMNYDLRTSENDGSQRMLNALLPGTEVAIHRHARSSENIICLCGKMDIILLEEKKERITNANGCDMSMDAQDVMCRNVLEESQRIHLCPSEKKYGCVVPAGTWHTVRVYEPSVIYEAKDGKYGEDGSEIFHGNLAPSSDASSYTHLHNSIGDLKKNIEYLIGKERAEGNLEELTAEYISRVLGTDIKDVREVLKDILHRNLGQM